MQLTVILQNNIIYLENFLNSAGEGGKSYAIVARNILTKSIITSSSAFKKDRFNMLCFHCK
jgi:hypothetical protein